MQHTAQSIIPRVHTRPVPALLLTLMLAAPALAQAGAPAAQPDQSPVIASGTGVTLTENDLRQELTIFEPQVRQRLLSDPQQAATLVNGLVRMRILVNEAQRLGLDQDPTIQRKLARVQGQILTEALRADALKQIEVPDLTERAREDYKVNAERYAVPEQVQARHILLRAKDPETLAKRRVELEAIAERIRKGESFETLARETSEDPGSAKNGGDLGLFGRGQMVPPFEEAAFALTESGQVSGIVETQFGVHLIQLVERKPAGQRAFEEVENMIVSRLRAEYLRQAIAAWERELVDAAKVEVDAERLKALLEAEKAATPASAP